MGEHWRPALRSIISEGVADIILHATREELKRVTIRAWCDRWLEAKALETSEGTHLRYKLPVQRFVEFLGKKADRDISVLSADDVLGFRNSEAKTRKASTANLSLKILRICFGEAVRQDLLQANPAARVKSLKSAGDSKRRGFTIAEIKRILKACGSDIEWRGLVLFGLYLGQRLGDLARLTWRAVDMEEREIAFTAQKTGRRVILPVLPPLIDYLASLSVPDNPDAYIFPCSASVKRIGSLSNQFRKILVEARLLEPRDYSVTTKGRTSKREASEISFHSLRHSATSLLKASGVSDVIAREIVGHESEAVSRGYTHLSTEDLRNAMKRLEDVTR
jgi:integrase